MGDSSHVDVRHVAINHSQSQRFPDRFLHQKFRLIDCSPLMTVVLMLFHRLSRAFSRFMKGNCDRRRKTEGCDCNNKLIMTKLIFYSEALRFIFIFKG